MAKSGVVDTACAFVSSAYFDVRLRMENTSSASTLNNWASF